MTVRCQNCHSAIDRSTARPEHFRGTTRWHCPDLQECAERGVTLRLGISISEQRARFKRVQVAA